METPDSTTPVPVDLGRSGQLQAIRHISVCHPDALEMWVEVRDCL